MKPVIITFYNAKGGVGKTTSALALADVLASTHDQQVLVIDLDLTQNSISSVLDPSYSMHEMSIIDVLLGNCAMNEAIYPSTIDKIHYSPCIYESANQSASIRPKESTLTIADFTEQELTLQKALSTLEDFSYIIIDCPPAMNALTINAIAASNGVVVPFKNDKYAYDGIEKMLVESSKVKDLYNRKLKFLGVFFTHDTNRRVDRQVKAVLSEELGDKFLKSTIRQSVLIPESSYDLLPVTRYKKYSDVASDYRKLTKEIIKRIRGE